MRVNRRVVGTFIPVNAAQSYIMVYILYRHINWADVVFVVTHTITMFIAL